VAYPASPIPILGLGAGSHAKSLLEAIRSLGSFEAVALVDDDPRRLERELLGIPVDSNPDALDRLQRKGVRHAFVGVGGTSDALARQRVFERLRDAGFELPPILHANAVVSSLARVGDGAQILACAVVNVHADIGQGAIVNTGAIVEHDCRVGDHAHVAPGARLAGLVTVGEGAHVGIGAVVIEGVRLGGGAFVAAGAVVVRDVEEGVRVAGVPAREMVASG
jgi:sugar O-acyltransferase (sialic acid O-acetyltransferase NeuD family)